MIYIRLHDELIELPTATALLEVDGRIEVMDESKRVVASFDKLDILAWSRSSERLRLDLGPERQFG